MWNEVILSSPERLWLLAGLPFFLGSIFLSTKRGTALVIAAALRSIAYALVVLVLCGLGVETRESARGACVIVSTDASESVGLAGAAARDDLLLRLATRLRSEDQLGAVVFARRAEVVAWPAAPPRVPSFGEPAVDPSATRLAAGIEAAVPLCPEETERAVVLVTDGNETVGDARRAAAFAQQSGVRLFAEVPRPSGGMGIALEKLLAPPLVREGSVFPLRLLVRSGLPQSTEGAVDLFVNGEAAAHQVVRLDPGVNVFEVPYQLHERGSYRLEARIAAQGAQAESQREASLAVAGPIRALVISEAPDAALAKVLEMKEVDVEFRRPKDFPKLEDLLQFHCVILDDVPRKALDEETLRSLESYVKNFGGGFVMTGGARSFGDRGYQKSPVERVLPVVFVEQKPPPKGRAPMGVFLLIDRSNSMGYNSRRRDQRDGEKMAYARQAARALIDQLRNDDRVGVIAFDSDPYVLGPLAPLSERRRELEDRISRLQPGGGTDFKASLEIAAAQLTASGFDVRHIILLTDGDTNRGAADHVPLIQSLTRIGISVTTIRIGDDDVNLGLLQDISSQTGGRFYHVEDIERLPQLIVNDTRAVGGEVRPGEGTARETVESRAPQLGEESQIVRGFSQEEFPLLREVPETHLKPGADLVLYLPEGTGRRPLLSTWQVGLGRAAAFPFDPSGAGAEGWIAWRGFGKFWSQLVRWAIREEAPWETRQTVRYEEGNPFLEVQTFEDFEEGTIVAEVFTSAQSAVDLPLVPVASRLYRSPLPPLAPGRYALLLTRRQGEKTVAQKREVLSIETAAQEGGSAELARKLPDLELLREITAETGGSVNPPIEELTRARGGTRVVRHEIDWGVIPLALGLLLGELAVRRRLGS